MNVKHRRCAENGCNTRPAFNWKGEDKGAFCNKHKEKGMVNVDKKEARAGEPVLAPEPCFILISLNAMLSFGHALLG